MRLCTRLIKHNNSPLSYLSLLINLLRQIRDGFTGGRVRGAPSPDQGERDKMRYSNLSNNMMISEL